ncbi:hypothetical protein FDE98_17915 [Clostridium sporogenes]|uniref:Uncharacterized protein n=1 Tax=Clostridium sporogenes TaxID=1509 RepID=A0A7X5PF91_CLOSG|nr:hypothetical protein [Clostridium sporogenes]AJD29277.1 hypothetical protein T258_4056 [Clostridium botulinum Prevot_594]NFL98416.1 hypothetical protein [Clostridium botulinum]NFP56258.1 hypothetical protein [Clostridium botulinum]NFQ18214.1 hypothetical protein [Clostridium sporogenes]NFQ22189.1 hypothetical protein [Clostridium sporogenes]
MEDKTISELTEEQKKLILDCLRIDEDNMEALLNSTMEHMSRSMRSYREHRLKEVRNLIDILQIMFR